MHLAYTARLDIQLFELGSFRVESRPEEAGNQRIPQWHSCPALQVKLRICGVIQPATRGHTHSAWAHKSAHRCTPAAAVQQDGGDLRAAVHIEPPRRERLCEVVQRARLARARAASQAEAVDVEAVDVKELHVARSIGGSCVSSITHERLSDI